MLFVHLRCSLSEIESRRRNNKSPRHVTSTAKPSTTIQRSQKNKTTTPSNLLRMRESPARRFSPEATTGPERKNEPAIPDPPPIHPSFIQVAKPYIFEQTIQDCIAAMGVNPLREEALRLQGVTWIDNVRRVLHLYVVGFTIKSYGWGANKLGLFVRSIRLWCITTSSVWRTRTMSITIWYCTFHAVIMFLRLTLPGCCGCRVVYCLQG